MLETEFLFFQGMKKRIDQRISEGNYDEAAVSMQKCMEYILNSLDGRNNDYQKVCVLFEVQARVMENHPQYPFYWHEWETVIKYCDQQMHLQGKPIDLEQLKSDTVIAHQMFEKIVQDYLNHGIGYDKLYNLIILQRKNGNLYVESGAGRNPIYDFEKNLIYQSVRREDSIVITDPEREICTEQMQDYLMKHGYAIKIYNAESMRKTQDMISVDSLTKEKTIWFIVTRQYHKDQSVFRTFMGNLYKSLITSAENAKMRSNVQMILFGYPMYGRIEGILEYMEHGKAAGIYTAICTKDWIMRGPADREWLKIKKDNEKYKICRNSDITMYVGLRGFFDIDDGESDPWKDKTYEDFYIGGYFISRYEQDAGIYYKNSKGEKIEDAGCNQYMSKKNPYGIQKT